MVLLKECQFHRTKIHRLVEVGWDLWVHLVQLLLKKGHLQQGAQEHILVAFEDIQVGESTTSLGNLCQCSGTLTVKKWHSEKPNLSLLEDKLILLTQDALCSDFNLCLVMHFAL